MTPVNETRSLGRTGIRVLPIGMGTNKWGRADRASVLQTYKTVTGAGHCLIDTAEVYGSERTVGDCLRFDASNAVIASKFAPFPGRSSSRSLMKALDWQMNEAELEAIEQASGSRK